MKKTFRAFLVLCFVTAGLVSCNSGKGFYLDLNHTDTCKSFRFNDGFNEESGNLKSVSYRGDGNSYAYLKKFLSSFKYSDHLKGQRFKIFKKNVLDTAEEMRTRDISLMWYVISYMSEYPEGKPMEEYALLLLPYSNEKTGSFPLVEINHGTMVGKERGTTSNNSDYSEWWAAWQLASTGVAVLVPEFPGFGPGQDEVFHPYMSRDALAVSARDALSAAVEFFDINRSKELFDDGIYDNGLDFDGQVAIAGYSEGGFTTLAVLDELEKNPVSDIELKLVLPMGSPCDVSDTMVGCFKSDAEYAHPFYLPYCFLGWNHLDEELFDEERVFSEKMRKEIVPLFKDKVSQDELEEKIRSVLDGEPCNTLLSEEALSWLRDPYATESGKRFIKILQENDVMDVTVPQSARVKIIHSPEDDCVPFANSVKLFESMKVNGVDVELIEVANDSHEWSFIDAWGYAYKFIMEEMMRAE